MEVQFFFPWFPAARSDLPMHCNGRESISMEAITRLVFYSFPSSRERNWVDEVETLKDIYKVGCGFTEARARVQPVASAVKV